MPKKTKNSRGSAAPSSSSESSSANISRPLTRAECANLLGVPVDCKDEEIIKKAYRSAALKTHPDKGGSEEAFKRVNEAYTKMKAYANGEPAGEDNLNGEGGGVTEADYDDFVREMMFQMGGGMSGGMGGLGFIFSQMFGSSPPRKRRGFMPRKSASKGKRKEEEEEEEEDEDDDDDDDDDDIFEDDDDDMDFFDEIFKPSSSSKGRPVFGGGRGTRRTPSSSSSNTSEAFFVPGVGFVEVSGGKRTSSDSGRRKTPKPGSAEYVRAFTEKNTDNQDDEVVEEEEEEDLSRRRGGGKKKGKNK
jgi:hypothetical protein